MKTFLLILLLSACCLAQDKSNHALILPGKLAAEWYFSDTAGTWDKDVKPETRIWLTVVTSNHRDWEKEGYNPSTTSVIVKDYKPVVHLRKDGAWEIVFTSPIAEDIP